MSFSDVNGNVTSDTNKVLVKLVLCTSFHHYHRPFQDIKNTKRKSSFITEQKKKAQLYNKRK